MTSENLSKCLLRHGGGQYTWWPLVAVLCKAPSLQEAVGSPRRFLYPWLSLTSFHSSLNLGTGRAKSLQRVYPCKQSTITQCPFFSSGCPRPPSSGLPGVCRALGQFLLHSFPPQSQRYDFTECLLLAFQNKQTKTNQTENQKKKKNHSFLYFK